MKHLKLFEAYFDTDPDSLWEEVSRDQFYEFKRSHKASYIIDVDILKLSDVFNVTELDHSINVVLIKSGGYDLTIYKFEDDWWIVKSEDADRVTNFYLCDSFEGLKDLIS